MNNLVPHIICGISFVLIVYLFLQNKEQKESFQEAGTKSVAEAAEDGKAVVDSKAVVDAKAAAEAEAKAAEDAKAAAEAEAKAAEDAKAATTASKTAGTLSAPPPKKVEEDSNAGIPDTTAFQISSFRIVLLIITIIIIVVGICLFYPHKYLNAIRQFLIGFLLFPMQLIMWVLLGFFSFISVTSASTFFKKLSESFLSFKPKKIKLPLEFDTYKEIWSEPSTSSDENETTRDTLMDVEMDIDVVPN